MTKELTTTPPKVHLGYSANALSVICEAIESSDDLDETMIALFNETSRQLSAGVGRRKAAARGIRYAIEQAKAYEKQVTHHRKKLESALDKLKEMTKEIVEAHPDLPFKDELGKKLTIVKNSKPGIRYDFELTYKTVRNIVAFDQPPAYEEEWNKYIKTEMYTVLDTGRVLADLEAGAELPWARLERGSHLRGL
jgi:hypothetical protein